MTMLILGHVHLPLRAYVTIHAALKSVLRIGSITTHEKDQLSIRIELWRWGVYFLMV